MRWGRFNFKARRIKRPFFRRIFFFLGLSLISLGIYKFLTTFFLVKTIKITGEREQVLKGIEKIGGENLLFLNAERWEEEIERQNPLIKEIEIKKEFPAQVLIKLKKREPKGLIFDPHSSLSFLIDEEGVILKKGEEGESLPAIIASLQNFKIGDRIRDKSIMFALDCIGVLEEKAQEAKFEVDESLKVLTATLADDILVLVSLEKDKEKTIYSLQILAQKFRIEGSWPKKIDLRFEKPILTF